MCWKCSGFTSNTEVGVEVTLDGIVIKKVAKFSNLADVLSFGVVLEDITARIRFEWKKL